MDKQTQIHLVKKAKKGDATAFITLCEAYQVILYNAAYKLLADNEHVADCLQETEIRAWQKIRQLRNEAAFHTWLFRIMINVAKALLKKRVDKVQFEEKMWTIEQQAEEVTNLDNILDYLPEKYKLPIVLHYYAGFSIKEIAQQLSMSQNTVKTRLARGRQQLKCLLEEK